MRFIRGTYFLAIGAGGPGKTVEKVLSRSGKTMDDIEDKEDDEGDNELGGAGTGTGAEDGPAGSCGEITMVFPCPCPPPLPSLLVLPSSPLRRFALPGFEVTASTEIVGPQAVVNEAFNGQCR